MSQLEVDFNDPENGPRSDPTTLSIAAHRAFMAAFAAVPVPSPKRPYLLNYGSGWSNPDWRWVWSCPLCPYRRSASSRVELDAEIIHHRHHRGPRVPWHPRYLMPPRYGVRD